MRIDDGVKEVLEIAMEQLLQENQNALLGLAGNFPLPVIGPLMGALCFPFGKVRGRALALPHLSLSLSHTHTTFPVGKAYHGPDDRMRQTVARVITNPSAFRSIMEEGIFISRDPNNRLRQVPYLAPYLAPYLGPYLAPYLRPQQPPPPGASQPRHSCPGWPLLF